MEKLMEVNSIDYHYHNAPRNPTDIELGVEPGYKQSISYINNTHIPIFIRDKTDLVIELLPENHIYNNDLKIIFTFEFNHLMIPNLNKFFSSLSESDLEKDICLKLLRKQFLDKVATHFSRFVMNKISLSLVYDIPYESMTKYSETVYIPDIDILIHTGDRNTIPRHPYSLQSKMNQFIDTSVPELENATFRFALDIIDNDDTLTPKYINITNTVVKIIPRKDIKLLSGIYVLNTSNSEEVDYYPLELMSELGLYNTKEDAISQGNIELVNKINLKKLETELESTKMEYANSKIKREAELAEVTHDSNMQIQAAKEKQLKAEQDLAEIKQKYEYNNYVRKEANESNKTLPTIILGVIGVTLGLAKLLSK